MYGYSREKRGLDHYWTHFIQSRSCTITRGFHRSALRSALRSSFLFTIINKSNIQTKVWRHLSNTCVVAPSNATGKRFRIPRNFKIASQSLKRMSNNVQLQKKELA